MANIFQKKELNYISLMKTEINIVLQNTEIIYCGICIISFLEKTYNQELLLKSRMTQKIS